MGISSLLSRVDWRRSATDHLWTATPVVTVWSLNRLCSSRPVADMRGSVVHFCSCVHVISAVTHHGRQCSASISSTVPRTVSSTVPAIASGLLIISNVPKLQASAPSANVQPFQQPRREYQPLKPEDLTNIVPDPDALKLPPGYHWYETMIVLRASINDQDR